MTTLHKTVLSLIAAICISLILYYSIQGNSRRPQPVAVVLPSAQPADVPATAPDEAARAAAMEQPVHVGPSAQPRPQGLEELVAKVRSEITTNEPAAAQEPAATGADGAPVLPSANAPTAASPDSAALPTGVDEFADFVPPDAADLSAAPSASSGDDIIAETITPPATTTPPALANDDAPAPVPTFTLGEPPSKQLIADEDDAATQPAQGGARSRDLIDGPVNELTDFTGRREALPPLARVREDDAQSPRSPEGESPAQTTTKPQDSPNDPVLLIDPHEPARKAEAPPIENTSASKTESTLAKTATPEPEAAANSASKAPPIIDAKPAPSTPATSTASRTYTVKPGDNFSAIAARELGAERHWIALVDANPGIDPKRIKVGQVINLPDMDGDEPRAVSPLKTTADSAKPTPAAKPAAAPAVDNSDVKIHEVAAGENLSSISRKHFKTPDHWRHIYLTNRDLIGSDPGKLHAGLKLKITAPKAE